MSENLPDLAVLEKLMEAAEDRCIALQRERAQLLREAASDQPSDPWVVCDTITELDSTGVVLSATDPNGNSIGCYISPEVYNGTQTVAEWTAPAISLLAAKYEGDKRRRREQELRELARLKAKYEGDPA